MDGLLRTLDPARAGQLVAVVLLAAAALVAQGQSAPPQEIENAPPQPVPGQVLSDIEPLPAEDRESTGAVVLHDSRVRAQREAFEAERRTGVTSAIRHNVARVLEEARGWDNLHEAGAGPAPAEGPPAPPSQ